jgi:hypothetical protein
LRYSLTIPINLAYYRHRIWDSFSNLQTPFYAQMHRTCTGVFEDTRWEVGHGNSYLLHRLLYQQRFKC